MIPQGRVSHFNWRWRGIVQGSPRLTMSIHWYMETAHLDEPHPPLWRIHVQGQPGVRISLDMEKRAGDTSPTSADRSPWPARLSMQFPSFAPRRRDRDATTGYAVPVWPRSPIA